jgi:hypothetical protein
MAKSKEEILELVRKLVARANSTEFDAERQASLKRADELMETYAIQTWQLEHDDESVKRIVRKDISIKWWHELSGLHIDARSSVWWLFEACIRHCRCVSSVRAQNYTSRTIAVYGLPADLDYLDLLFTDLFTQLFAKIKPSYQPDKDLGFNMYIAKEAGMSWEQAAKWAGMPELVRTTETYSSRTGRYSTKVNVDGKLVRAYKKYLSDHNLERIVEHPHRWQISFCEGFYYSISERLRNMREERAETHTGSMSLALRDIEDQARDEMYEDFPELRPHPEGCECERCTAKRKPVKYRDGFRASWAAAARGGQAGKEARIASRDPSLRKQREIN